MDHSTCKHRIYQFQVVLQNTNTVYSAKQVEYLIQYTPNGFMALYQLFTGGINKEACINAELHVDA